MTTSKDATNDVNNNFENIPVEDESAVMSDLNDVDTNVNDLHEGIVNSGEFVSEDDKHDVSPDVNENENFIDDVEGDILAVKEVVVAQKISKKPKR